MKTRGQTKPSARKEGLIVQTLPDETLVYDLDRDLAHCLNHTASLIWHRCDGRTTAKQIARTLAAELSQPVDEKLVWLALDQLGRNHLLAEGAVSVLPAMNRREVVRALATTAVIALPVVASIIAPTPVQAATGCLPQGAACQSSAECCSGLCFQSTCAAN